MSCCSYYKTQTQIDIIVRVYGISEDFSLIPYTLHGRRVGMFALRIKRSVNWKYPKGISPGHPIANVSHKCALYLAACGYSIHECFPPHTRVRYTPLASSQGLSNSCWVKASVVSLLSLSALFIYNFFILIYSAAFNIICPFFERIDFRQSGNFLDREWCRRCFN